MIIERVPLRNRREQQRNTLYKVAFLFFNQISSFSQQLCQTQQAANAILQLGHRQLQIQVSAYICV